MIEERDLSVPVRDGRRLAVDVYRADAPGRYPIVCASALHNKDMLATEFITTRNGHHLSRRGTAIAPPAAKHK